MANIANDSETAASGAIAMVRPAGNPFWQQDNVIVSRPGNTYTGPKGTKDPNRPLTGQLWPRGNPDER